MARPMNDVLHDTIATNRGWDARLELAFERRGPRTAMVRNAHRGPLVVQKALYPEDPAQCHAVVVHPPGGIAGGDRLAIDVSAHEHAEVLLTTPGATRWYRSDGPSAEQHVRIRADQGAIVEWLPLETIVFDGTDACSTVTVECAGSACVAGWEIIVFGRRAMGESFRSGRFRQQIEIRRDGRLLWAEYGEVQGADPLFDSPIGYAGQRVSGLLWLADPSLSAQDADGDATRRSDMAIDVATDATDGPRAATLVTGVTAGITVLPDGIMLARCLGASTETVKHHLLQVWQQWRPRYAQRAATMPRLWAT